MPNETAPTPPGRNRWFGRLLAAGLTAIVVGGAWAAGPSGIPRLPQLTDEREDTYLDRQERILAALPPRVDLRVGPHAPGRTPTEATARDLVSRYDCRHLAWDAAEQTQVQSDYDRYLLTVRALHLLHDGRGDYRFPAAGDPDPILMTCRGTGVWGDGTDLTPVTLFLKVTARYEVYGEFRPD